jgi:hypothetical protein
MAAGTDKPVLSSKAGPNTASGTNASIRLEKGKPGVRRSTPDSEALTSSDDEFEHLHQVTTAHTAPITKPTRRTSWLNEVPQNLPRKASLTAAGSLASPGIPSSSAADQPGWGAATSPSLNSSMSWGHGGSFPWATGIWTSETRKEPPPRLTELSQSPTMPSMAATSSGADEILSPTARSMAGESSIPFTIPLHPTPKTYRSQSYSVGQLDPETMNLMSTATTSQLGGVRGRPGNQVGGLQHRTSRPSMLEDLGHDPALLGRVREDDADDEENANELNDAQSYTSNQARTIEQLTRENALLRQAARFDGSRLRDRAVSSASVNSNYSLQNGLHSLHRIQGSVPEESDLAVEDLDELGDIPGYGGLRNSGRRRLSEHSANLERQLAAFGSVENRPLENLKRAHWQTSLGFGSIGELSQSRRHSFADIPTRHGSIGSIGENPSRAGLRDHEDDFASALEGALSTPTAENCKSHPLSSFVLLGHN